MDNRESQARGSLKTIRRRAILLGILGVLLTLGIGVLIGRGLAPDQQLADPGASLPRLVENSPATAQTEQGAVDAATTFARILPGPAGDEDTYRADMVELAAPDWGNRARELAANAIQFVHDRYGEGGRVSFHPVRYRVHSYSDREATIDIWGVVLAVGPKLAGVEESWITGTLDLVWIEDQWKVQGQSSQGGPTPELLRADGNVSVPTILENFRAYEDAQRR